jgi:hypothetical protein
MLTVVPPLASITPEVESLRFVIPADVRRIGFAIVNHKTLAGFGALETGKRSSFRRGSLSACAATRKICSDYGISVPGDAGYISRHGFDIGFLGSGWLGENEERQTRNY